MNVLFLCYIFVNVVTLTHGQSYTETNDLLEHLFTETRYNRHLRPLKNQTNMMKVTFTKYLKGVEHFDISTGVVIVTGYFEINWTDEFLTWDPHLYGQREIIQLPKGKFWKPEFELMNGQAYEESSIYSNGAFLGWVTYNGNVLISPAGTYQTRCKIDTTLYPLDIHQCSFHYIVSNHGAEELSVHSPTGNVDTNNIEENGEWHIENTNVIVTRIKSEKNNNISKLMVEAFFTLRRRPASSIINTYAPLTLMANLNMASCFIKPNSGERISFAITLYLSLVFATTAATEEIPNNSLKMPYMSYEILVLNIVNTIGVVYSIFIVHLANIKEMNQNKMPDFILKRLMKRKKEKLNLKGHSTDSTCTATTLEDDGDIIKEANDEVESPKIVITGIEFAKFADLVYFWFIFVIVFTLNLVFVILLVAKWASNNKNTI